MPKPERRDERITVETDSFEHRTVQAHFINPCCFGEDFAAWLKQSLSHLDFDFSEIIQEDYGWGFWASYGHDRFWIALSYVGNGPQEPPAQWVISVVYDPGLNLIRRIFHRPDQAVLRDLRNQIKQAVVSNIAMKLVPTPSYGA